MVKTTVYLEAEAYRELKQLARAQGQAPAALIRQAVAEFARSQRRRGLPRSVGRYRSGRADLGERSEELLRGLGEA
ncbi:MAG TPA: ribbon-helix-helix protein, CopG family [Terriglobales bacterium]|nr:ribbon-helix-helix protein, CopG family [Terriglobales bacterium]